MKYIDLFRFKFQFEVALAIDAATVLRHALSKMAAQHPEIFRRVSHNGQVNGSESIDCDAEPVRPWKIGSEVMKHIRDVSIYLSIFVYTLLFIRLVCVHRKRTTGVRTRCDKHL